MAEAEPKKPATPKRPAPAKPVTHQDPARTRTLVGVGAVLVVASLACGFVAGRATAPPGADVAACASATAAEERLTKERDDAPSGELQDVKDSRLAVMANVILQNPDCFNPSVRADAQTAKEQIAARADAQAMSDAAERAAQCAKPLPYSAGC
jgi:hypothetical protein